ncbi:sugar-phosphatase [Paenibacillus larvae]|uniref:HAD-superfamily hydrolase n=1 Tax=Paenibacillus larvae subsp. larvae TaxID=147375 RepID=A0A6C0QTI8_9BACL|nr:sugar-phosphatase [Paenibacillus larvae]QHZ52059.1 HAD-superfamily hydrolase [Paenibacillus larvae subsp. larvae]
MYKLIAVDMDGTLLGDNHAISEASKKAIQEAREQGVQVVLATGRPLVGIEKFLEELDLISEQNYAICYNGSVVQNTGTGEVIAKQILNGQDLHQLYGLSLELGVNIHAFSRSGLITPKASKYTRHEADLNGIDFQVADFKKIGADEDIIKIMFVDEEERLSRAISRLPQSVKEAYTIVQSSPFFLEFLNKRAHKGEGVKKLAEHLGISREEIICVGDAGNDLHMIEYAGLGVAMGNAFNEIKHAADFITKTNNEDGVAHVIETFILGNKGKCSASAE